jgi:hypothetical protein
MAGFLGFAVLVVVVGEFVADALCLREGAGRD